LNCHGYTFLLYYKSTSNLQCKKQGGSFLEFMPQKTPTNSFGAAMGWSNKQ